MVTGSRYVFVATNPSPRDDNAETRAGEQIGQTTFGTSDTPTPGSVVQLVGFMV
jgi:hypothetical protein